MSDFEKVEKKEITKPLIKDDSVKPATAAKPVAAAVTQPVTPPVATKEEKTLSTSDQKGCKQAVPDVVIFGDDMFKLMSKASSEKEGWMKSTKACEMDRGCLVQVTTQQRNKDGSYAVAEALTFVPGARIKIIKDAEGNIIARNFVGAK